MASKEFEEWLSGQPHKRDEEVPTGAKRAFLKYIVPSGVKTWGDWYDLAKITPDFEKPKEKKPAKAKTETAPVKSEEDELREILERKKDKWDEQVGTWLEGNWTDPGEDEADVVRRNAEGELEGRYENLKKRLLKNPDNLELAYEIRYTKYQLDVARRVAKAYKLSAERIKYEDNIRYNEDKLSALENAGEGNTPEAEKIKRQLARSRAALIPAKEAQEAFDPKFNAALERASCINSG